jgi:hypothetical protein
MDWSHILIIVLLLLTLASTVYSSVVLNRLEQKIQF